MSLHIGRRSRSVATGQEPMTNLQIDWTRCVGHGVCAAAFGEQISLDRWGYPDGVATLGRPIPKTSMRAAKAAVATCPAVALRLLAQGDQ